jgi:hypothetical protein
MSITRTGWAKVEDIEDDINRNLEDIDRVDATMLQSQLDTVKGFILAIIGNQYADYEVDNSIWAIHKEASINQTFYKLNQMGVKGFDAPDAILTDEHLFILSLWKDNNPAFDEDEPFDLPFADEDPQDQGQGSTFWFQNGDLI